MTNPGVPGMALFRLPCRWQVDSGEEAPHGPGIGLPTQFVYSCLELT